MKQYISIFIFYLIFPVLLFAGEDISFNAKLTLEEYILRNELPIIINDGNDINILNDYGLEEKIKFEIFLLDLNNIIFDLIAEGDSLDEVLLECEALIDMWNGYYEAMNRNNYEVPAIIYFTNECWWIAEYLESENFSFIYHNRMIILDYDTSCIKLAELWDFLLQAAELSRNNLTKFHTAFGETDDSSIYNKAERYWWRNNYYCEPDKTALAQCYNMLNVIFYLFKINNYNLAEYEKTHIEIRERQIEDWNNRVFF